MIDRNKNNRQPINNTSILDSIKKKETDKTQNIEKDIKSKNTISLEKKKQTLVNFTQALTKDLRSVDLGDTFDLEYMGALQKFGKHEDSSD